MEKENILVEKLKNKIQNPNYEYMMDYIIYNFLMQKTTKNWDLRKSKIIGIGEIINSQTGYNWKKLKKEDVDNTPQVLIVQEGSKDDKDAEISALVLNPMNDTPLGDAVKNNYFKTCWNGFENISSDGKKLGINNFIDEYLVLSPYDFKNAITFSTFLNAHQLKLNDYLVKNMKNGYSFNYFDEALKNVFPKDYELKLKANRKNQIMDILNNKCDIDKSKSAEFTILKFFNERKKNKENCWDFLDLLALYKDNDGLIKECTVEKDKKGKDYLSWYWVDKENKVDNCYSYKYNPDLIDSMGTISGLSGCLIQGFEGLEPEDKKKIEKTVKEVLKKFEDKFNQLNKIVEQNIEIANKIKVEISDKMLNLKIDKEQIEKLVEKELDKYSVKKEKIDSKAAEKVR